jgi:hypothetical protein
MVRRSTPIHKIAEGYFPVRIRVHVPPSGLGKQLDDMHWWLNQTIGREKYWVWSDCRPGLPDGALFYFTELAHAQAFVARFACGVWVRGDWPPFPTERCQGRA